MSAHSYSLYQAKHCEAVNDPDENLENMDITKIFDASSGVTPNFCREVVLHVPMWRSLPSRREEWTLTLRMARHIFGRCIPPTAPASDTMDNLEKHSAFISYDNCCQFEYARAAGEHVENGWAAGRIDTDLSSVFFKLEEGEDEDDEGDDIPDLECIEESD
ncbi:hypothetical protein B0H12DRAFT_1077826 [Mycena haematopus]|nr:hypothetical protein B0H12DRAFT_1077826 [Mycena haematopus]